MVFFLESCLDSWVCFGLAGVTVYVLVLVQHLVHSASKGARRVGHSHKEWVAARKQALFAGGVEGAGRRGASDHGAGGICGCHNPLWRVLAEQGYFAEKQNSRSPVHVGEDEKESRVYTGGVIRPVALGNAEATVEALGVHAGKVVACGKLTDVENAMKSCCAYFETVHLEDGQTILPGFVEPHCHIVPSALLREWDDVGPFQGEELRKDYNVDWVTKTVRSGAGFVPSKWWILCHGVDPALMGFHKGSGQHGLNQLVHLDTKALDDMISNRPLLILSASLHTIYCNSLAVQQIFESSAQAKQSYSDWQEFRKFVDEKGGLQEYAGIKMAILAIPKDQLLESTSALFSRLEEVFEEASSKGLTLLYDASFNTIMRDILKVFYMEQAKQGKTGRKVKVLGANFVESQADAEKLARFAQDAGGEYKDLAFNHIKIVSDGSNQGLTGYQSKAYCCEPVGNVGCFNYPDKDEPCPTSEPQDFQRLVSTVAEKGWPLMIHANGSLAVEFTIQALESTQAKNKSDRNRIEHCSLLTQSQLDRMTKSRISPSFLIGHIGFWGYVFQNAIFQDSEASKLDLAKSALERGLRISGHSDSSVTPLGPLRIMDQFVTRIMEADPLRQVLQPHECLTPAQALVAVTYDAAWQCAAETWTGSLEPGKHADFVVLAHDPLSYRGSLRQIRVVRTVCEGRQTFPALTKAIP